MVVEFDGRKFTLRMDDLLEFHAAIIRRIEEKGVIYDLKGS